ncbi:MAG: efflux RND transporter permease subunit [Helicobacter sp.]|nr:efflux RND transporter permease subunit [Helicobacter sp.]
MIQNIITRPVVVIVGMILLVLFGTMALRTMPYQLTPKVIRPIISVQSTWNGATPYEIEREIIERQENALKGLDGLQNLQSRSRNGRGYVFLEFSIGTPLNVAMLDVSNKLSEVKGYPDSMERPIIRATGEDVEAVVFMVLKTIDPTKNVREYRTFFNEQVIQHFERIDGVAEVSFPGGEDREMHIILDSQKLAAYNLSITDAIAAIEGANINVSAGTMNYGQKAYRVRTIAEYKTPEDIRETLIFGDGLRRIKIGDIASVRSGFANPSTVTLHNFQTSLGIGIKPTNEANTLELTAAVALVFDELNEGLLKEHGLRLEWMSDQSGYIKDAIALVQNNILIGILLASSVLFLFLRSWTATLIIALSMPLSIFGTFIVMAFLGRTLNVISMAGISFAVGMLVDSAIVVLENIERHKAMGKSPLVAVYEGSAEVIGSLIASVATTIAIFIPIINISDVSGQLFRDIAIAASSAVCFSIFVSLVVIPTMSYQSMCYAQRRKIAKPNAFSHWLQSVGNGFVQIMMRFVRVCMRNKQTTFATIIGFTMTSLVVGYALFPKMEYLPQGNQNQLILNLNPPPGTSYYERLWVGEQIFELARPYFTPHFEGNATIPAISQLYYLGSENSMRVDVRTNDPSRPTALKNVLREIAAQIPGVRGTVSQPAIFAKAGGGGRDIEVNVSGERLEDIVATAAILREEIREILGSGTQVRALPSLEILYPELNYYPINERLSAVGLSSREFGIALDVLLDGRKVAEYKEEGRDKIDLVLRSHAQNFTDPEALYNTSLFTPKGGIVPLSNLAIARLEYGINEIFHHERMRTTILIVSPPDSLALQQAMEMLQAHFDSPHMREVIGDNNIKLSGNADKLTQMRIALEGGFLLAVLIIYLLMAALYENFIYPLIILFTIPLAVAGGMIGIWLVNVFLTPQPLDVLTMFGFIILVGIVVNNAILIVYQSLYNVKQNSLDVKDGIIEAVQARIRPIYMSTLTSIFGMLPLVLAPGAGSEIYRGLGAVILGGLAFSTVITIFVIPCLLSLFLKKPTCKQISRQTPRIAAQ